MSEMNKYTRISLTIEKLNAEIVEDRAREVRLRGLEKRIRRVYEANTSLKKRFKIASKADVAAPSRAIPEGLGSLTLEPSILFYHLEWTQRQVKLCRVESKLRWKTIHGLRKEAKKIPEAERGESRSNIENFHYYFDHPTAGRTHSALIKIGRVFKKPSSSSPDILPPMSRTNSNDPVLIRATLIDGVGREEEPTSGEESDEDEEPTTTFDPARSKIALFIRTIIFYIGLGTISHFLNLVSLLCGYFSAPQGYDICLGIYREVLIPLWINYLDTPISFLYFFARAFLQSLQRCRCMVCQAKRAREREARVEEGGAWKDRIWAWFVMFTLPSFGVHVTPED